MADVRRALHTVLFAAASIVLMAFTVRFMRADPRPMAAGALPTAEHLDSLGRYLQPVQPAAQPDDYEIFLPADDPPPAGERPPEAEPRTAPEWRVSAIIIASSRPIAIINDQTVAPGSALPDGSVVESIEREHVVIREPNGVRHRLSLTTG
jgi:hypothetical protein